MVAGVAVLVDDLLARRHVRGLLIHRLVVIAGQHRVGHDHIVVIHLGAHNGAGQLVGVVVIGGDDLDGIVPAVAEGEVRPAPAHRGVAADGHVAGVEHVAVAQDDVQIAEQHRVVQRGGHLADAAADTGGGTPGLIDAGLLIAAGRRALPHRGVVPELLAGVVDLAVDGGGGQLDVLVPAPRPGALGGEGAQHVPEHTCLQLLGGHGGELHLGVRQELRARSGGVQLRLHRRHIKGHAHTGLRRLARGLVANGLRLLPRQLVVERLHVHGLGLLLLIGARHRRQRAALQHGGQVALQLLRVQHAAVGGLGDIQPLALFQTVAAVHHRAVQAGGQIVTSGIQRRGIHGELRHGGGLGKPAVYVRPAAPQPGQRAAAPALVPLGGPGGDGGGLRRHGDAQRLQRHVADGRAVLRQGDGGVLQELRAFFRPQRFNLLVGEPGHVQPQHVRVGKGGAAVDSLRHHAGGQIGQHQHAQHDADDQRRLFAPGHGGLFRDGSGRAVPAYSHRGHVVRLFHGMSPPFSGLYRAHTLRLPMIPQTGRKWVTIP